MTDKTHSRRRFVRQSAIGVAGIPFFGMLPEMPLLAADTTIQEVIDLLIEACTGDPLAETVDTVKSGNPTDRCTGIAGTFLATAEVIKAAAEKDVNLIITHEPTFYNHLDETDWLEDDPVYEYKRKLLEDNGIVVWRFHDYWHKHQPDGILHGFLKTVGWKPYLQKDRENTCLIPETSLKDLAAFFKGQLELNRCFYVGDLDMRFRNVGLLPGAWGREKQIQTLRREDIEVLVVGEVAEWETAEWVRDAQSAGLKKGLIVLGHAMSEEPGMEYLVEWLRPKVPGVPVHHLPAGDPFQPV